MMDKVEELNNSENSVQRYTELCTPLAENGF
jgi:hypothetical protein